MKRFRPAFVVTLSAVAASTACGQTYVNPPPPRTHNPPGPDDSTPQPDPSASATGTATFATPPTGTTAAPAKMLNAVDTQNRTIYRGTGSSCFVHLPFPAGAVVPPGKMPPIQDVTCPTTMADSAWNSCLGGTLYSSGGDSCTCVRTGNPPPPDQAVACPGSK
ncbi:MAG: hypothetical protein IPK82_41270 [Polyangiaceae bacterium]|nr:hypothetical protein [Polyangiaceae bacterium]